MNFSTMCQENTSRLEDLFTECLSRSTDKACIQEFATAVERNGRIGINMRPTVVLNFLISGTHLNVHEWADEIALRSRKDKQTILREKLGPFYENRIAFDLYFEGGEQFRYGALNIGGVGTEYYGEYCVILQHASICATHEIGYLMGDSLSSYVIAGPRVNESKLRQECAPDSHKHCLATIKHSSKIESLAPDAWSSMLCSTVNYIEAIVRGELRPDGVEAVRISKADYDLYWEYAFNEFTGRLTEVDRYRVDTFASIVEHLNSWRIRLQEVDS